MEAERTTRLTAHGYRWVAAADFAGTLAGEEGLVAEAGELVKWGPVRRVRRVRLPGAGEVFVKRYPVTEAAERLKYLFRRAKALREWRSLRELRAAGVEAPEPLAAGVLRRGGILRDSVLVTRGLEGALPLDEYLLEHVEAASHAEVAAFTRALAGFLRRAHGAGFYHRDFHAANVMVAGEPERPRFAVLDLADARVGCELTRGERLEMLATLSHLFLQAVPRHWRLRFLRSYLGPDDLLADAAALVEALSESGSRAAWRRRDAKTFGDRKYFRRAGASPFRGVARRTEAGEAAVELFRGGDPLEGRALVVKDSRSSKAGVVDIGGPQPRRFFVKRRNPRGGLKRLFAPLRRSRAMKGFFFGAAFENRSLPSPRAYAALEGPHPDGGRASWLVLEHLEGAAHLGELMPGEAAHLGELMPGEAADLGEMMAGEAAGLGEMMAGEAAGPGRGEPVANLSGLLDSQRSEFLSRLARMLRRLHWCGFSLRDLKSSNVLLFERGGRLDFAFSDLDAARLYRGRCPERRAMQNLARLYFDAARLGGVSRREALFFLDEYLGHPGREELSRWLCGIAAFVRAKRASRVSSSEPTPGAARQDGSRRRGRRRRGRKREPEPRGKSRSEEG